jgi:alpha-beta hydrolase superfamily lysophospholipase
MPPPVVAFAIRAADGAHVTAYKAAPPSRPRGIVQIAHGMAEHMGRYRRLIAALASAGYAVYAADHRGHGASAAAHGLGEFGPGGFASLVGDMATVSAVARTEVPDTPLILLGHSMGSFAAQLYLLEHHRDLAALVLSGTAAVDVMAAAMAAAGAAPGLEAMNAAFAPARTGFDWLSRDDAEVDAYIADPLCGYPLAAAALASVIQSAAPARHDPRLADVRPDLPILVISGERDPVTGPGQAFAQALIDSCRAAGLTRIHHEVYAGGRHEMFNETNREEVTADLIAWLDGAVGPAS